MRKLSVEHVLKTWLVLFLFVVISLSSAATADQALPKASPKPSAKTASPTAVISKTKPKAGSKLFMWKATSESGAILYLLGTVHVFKPEYYPLPDEMEKAFNKASALLVEINATKSNPAAAQAILRQKGLYTPPDNLSQHLDPVVCARVEKMCTELNLPFERMKMFKPWFVVIQATLAEVTKLGYSTKDGIDLHFMNEASSAGKKIIGLETEEFQLNLFADFPAELQEKWLQMETEEAGKMAEEAGKLMKAWQDGDDKGIDEITVKELQEHPEFAPVQDKILYERNGTMAEKLELYLKGKGVYLCAVGAGHLSGDRSILSILKQKGYQITQVKVGDAI